MASQQITEETVYLCTGNPLPTDIEQIAFWLLNESFADGSKSIHNNSHLSYNQCTLLFYISNICYFYFSLLNSVGISEMKTKKGLALIDIVREVTM